MIKGYCFWVKRG